jgi:hypothetical protein
MTFEVRRERGFLGILRATALIAALLGAVGSIGFLLRAGQRTHRLLLVIMAVWVVAPFMAVVLADAVAKRWSVLTRAALYGVVPVLTLGSLAIYTDDALRPRAAQVAFVFVVVPLASWALLAIVVPLAALISRRRSRRGDGA